MDEREGLKSGGDIAIMLKRVISKNLKGEVVRRGDAAGGRVKEACRNDIGTEGDD